MGPKILTVDDSKTIRLIIGKAFKSFDCEVLEACNGVEGLAVAAKERPDIIILDITMPVMDGFETLTKLKSDPDLKGIPVIMLTAEAGRDNVLKIAKQGVRDYLIKPFKEELIVDRVSRVIDLKPKGGGGNKAKRFDDPIRVLIVDDKPAICDQITGAILLQHFLQCGAFACVQAQIVRVDDGGIVERPLDDGGGVEERSHLRGLARLQIEFLSAFERNFAIPGVQRDAAVNERKP